MKTKKKSPNDPGKYYWRRNPGKFHETGELPSGAQMININTSRDTNLGAKAVISGDPLESFLVSVNERTRRHYDADQDKHRYFDEIMLIADG
ncbi:hypothetical protein RvY_00413 [Ramazzottius varieornatus]|uniref:Uncharacterized protein n=1 Tax=Ramazzottius varieornatus TaxID=947166 RepID=A0A1D1UN49_RAMVA|nr:hypothetical protein RvY_00413 [Ramazzottius varieornatus]